VARSPISGFDRPLLDDSGGNGNFINPYKLDGSRNDLQIDSSARMA
jgi:hypothetical protein